MRLKKLTLENFKDCKKFCFDPNCSNVTISGANETGKTTLWSAYTWLLTGKDARGRENYEIQTRHKLSGGGLGEIIHGLELSVVGEFVDNNGEIVSIGRTASEDWSKKKGAAEATLKGIIYGYYINDVPKPKTEFQKFIDEKFGPQEILRVITNLTFFNGPQLAWKDRRNLMMAMVAEVTVDQVIEANPELLLAKEILLKMTVEDALAQLKAQRKKTNDDISEIPVRISEINKSLEAPAESVSIDALKAQKLTQVIKKGAFEDLIRNATKNSAEVRNKLYEQIAYNESQLAKNKADAMKGERDRQLRDLEVEGLEKQKAAIFRTIAELEGHAQASAQLFRKIESDKALLLEQYKAEKTKVYEFPIDENCHACGQNLPADQVGILKAQAEKKASETKEQRLGELVSQGTRAKESMERAAKEILQHEADQAQQIERIEKLNQQIEALKTQTFEYTDYSKQNEQLQGLIDSLKMKAEAPAETVDTSNETQGIATCNAEIEKLDRLIANQDSFEKAKTRIEELKRTEKALGASMAAADGKILMLETFIQKKVEMQEGSLNGLFDRVTFKLFEIQFNGGLKEKFETLVDGIPYEAANTAGAVAADIEIVQQFARHYKIDLPIWIDNRESVTKIPEVSNQTISLVVDPTKSNLEVKIDE